MKKLLLLFVMTLLPVLASAESVEIDGVWYNLIPKVKVAEVTHANYSGVVIIPDKVTSDGVEYIVTKITDQAFYNCGSLTSVTIPGSVNSIGNYAFSECYGLTSVHISDLKAWCEIKFADYSSNPLSYAQHLYMNGEEIKELIIPSDVTFISDNAFNNCSALTSVTIPNSVISIGKSAFNKCNSLTVVHISDLEAWCKISFSEGASNPLYYAKHLYLNGEEVNDLIIPNSVTSIGSSAFSGCISLTSVTIPSSVITIGKYAFEGCTNLTSVHISDIGAWCRIKFPDDLFSVLNQSSSNPLYYAKHLYLNGEEVKDLVIPDGVTYIGSSAFCGCEYLTSVTIPNSVTYIGEYAFYNCNDLTSVFISNLSAWCEILFYNYSSNPLFYAKQLYLDGEEVKDLVIPNGVTSIRQNAFLNCSSLSSCTIPNTVTTIDDDAFNSCSGLSSINLPNSVISIGEHAFSECSNLSSLTIGSGVELINSEAFAQCKELKDVFCYATSVPTTKTDAFRDSYSEYITLHVPDRCVDAYKAIEPWNTFKEIVSMVEINYKLTYMVDGEEYKSYQIAEGSAITPEAAPTKDGYVFSGWTKIPATMPAEDVTITGTFTLLTDEDVIQITSAGQSTWCSKYDLDFTGVEGLKAYTATGYDRISGTIWLTRVYQVPANEGIFLMGNADEYHVPHKSTGTYYANLMVGTLQPITIYETDGEYTNYYLSNGDSGVGFYKVNGSVDLKANRAYLPLLKGSVQAGTRFIGIEFEDDGTTSIKGLTPALSEGEGEWYTLQGQRVAKPGKGLYIHNGKKVVIK